MENWKRSSSVPYPNVWRKFTKVHENGLLREYQIEDATDELFSECVNFMVKYFIPDEVLYNAIGFSNDQLSIDDQVNAWKTALSDKLSLVCTTKDIGSDKSKIVGVYILYVHTPEHDLDVIQAKGEKYKLICNIVNHIENRLDRYNFLEINKYLDEFGVCVHPEYRGIGIATELLRARIRLGALMGLKISISVCTSIASQRAAEKSGFQNLIEINYSELATMFSFLSIPTDTPTIRYMYALNKR